MATSRTLLGARVPSAPIIPLPEAPIEYPPAEDPEPEPEPREEPEEAPQAEPIPVPAPEEPAPLGA